MNNTENGRSMIEMLGVLAIIGVLSVGGIAGYSKAMMKYRINKTIEQVTLIAGNLRSFTATQQAGKRYAGLCVHNECKGLGIDGSAVRKAKLIPDEMMLDDWTSMRLGSSGDRYTSALIVNTFGGAVEIRNNCSGSCSDGDLEDVAKLTFYSIPQEACIDIASQDWSALNPEAVCVNTHYCSGFIDGVDDAITKCNKGDYNILFFVIK